MAIIDYTSLQNAVSDWLNKENVTTLARIPDFIAFGENAIFRNLRTRDNEATTTYLASAGDNSAGVALPERYKEAKSLTYADKLLIRKSDQWFNSQDQSRGPGQPKYYARIGNELKFYPAADENADVRLIYYEQQPAIDDVSTPALFVATPELYLFAALIEGYPFLQNQDPNDLAVWQMKYTQLMTELKRQSWAEEQSGSTNTVSAGYSEPVRNF